MKKILASAAGIAALMLALALVPSCRKGGDTLKSDLEEAGYQLTAEDWFRASRGNDAAVLKKFVSGKFPVDTRDPAGDSALHAAAAGGAQVSADYLLTQGLSVDLRGAMERTPLMAAVLADQTPMVRWLLRQGADPRLKDKEGFRALMLAVREGKSGSVGELAAYTREDLDSALLLASLVGRADVIDALTNFGASVYARMEDGRTALMIASENGHAEAVTLLLDIGAGRFTTDSDGRTAADLATAAGHPEIAALILRDPQPGELALEAPEEIAESMDAFVDEAVAKASGTSLPEAAPPAAVATPRAPSRPIAGERLSGPVGDGSSFPMPPLVMRHFREKEVPLKVGGVQGDVATLTLAGATEREVEVRVGDRIPGSSMVVVRVRKRMEESKVNPSGSAEISLVEVRDLSTGTTREWISGVPPKAHDPVALVEDAATGKRYLASPGQRFTAADGSEYLVSDVRPDQIVIVETASGEVRTIPLRGPRG
jgi:ankyrin repeat protein